MGRSFATGILIAALGTLITVGAATATEDERHSGWPFWGMDHMMSGNWGPGSAMGWWQPDGMLDRLDGRLAYMKTELRITPEQAGAWEEFAKVVKSSAAAHNEMMLSMKGRIEDRQHH